MGKIWAAECRDIDRSSFIQRGCYDKAQSHMIISLKGAPSMSQFFDQNIKGSGSDGPNDCRTHRVLTYYAKALIVPDSWWRRLPIPHRRLSRV